MIIEVCLYALPVLKTASRGSLFLYYRINTVNCNFFGGNAGHYNLIAIILIPLYPVAKTVKHTHLDMSQGFRILMSENHHSFATSSHHHRFRGQFPLASRLHLIEATMPTEDVSDVPACWAGNTDLT